MPDARPLVVSRPIRRRTRPTRRVSAWPAVAVVGGILCGAAIGLERSTATVAVLAGLALLVGILAVGLATSQARRSSGSGGPGSTSVANPTDARTSDLRRGFWLATAATLFIVAGDVQGVTLGGAPAVRYGLLFLPSFIVLAAAAVSHGGRLDRLAVPDRFLLVLVACGLLGAIYGTKVLGTATSGLVIFLPMSVGLIHLLVRERVTESEAARSLQSVIWISLLFLLLGVLARTSIWPLGLPTHVAHERAFLVAMGGAAAVFSRRRGALLAILVLVAMMFLQYPAATWLVVLASVMATGYATSRRGRGSAALVLITFAACVFGFGFVQVQGGRSTVAKDYFASVGKGDNTDTRNALWRAAEREIERSPIVGSKFTGNFTVENVDQVISNRGVQQAIEPHNDYIEILLLGGLCGLFLFVGFIVATNTVVIRRIHLLADEGSTAQASLARVLLIGFNAALSTAFFNPVLSQLGMCTAIFLVYAFMMSLKPAQQVSLHRERRS